MTLESWLPLRQGGLRGNSRQERIDWINVMIKNLSSLQSTPDTQELIGRYQTEILKLRRSRAPTYTRFKELHSNV